MGLKGKIHPDILSQFCLSVCETFNASSTHSPPSSCFSTLVFPNSEPKRETEKEKVVRGKSNKMQSVLQTFLWWPSSSRIAEFKMAVSKLSMLYSSEGRTLKPNDYLWCFRELTLYEWLEVIQHIIPRQQTKLTDVQSGVDFSFNSHYTRV